MKAYIKVGRIPDAPAPTRAYTPKGYRKMDIASGFTAEKQAQERIHRIEWTDDMITELTTLYKRGRSYSEIAREMDLPDGVVQHRIRVMIGAGELERRTA